MFSDIISAPQQPAPQPTKPKKQLFNLNKPRESETPKVLDKRLYPQSSLSEQVMKLNDLNQLIQILEIAKNKVKRKKIKQRKNRKIKW